MRHCQLCGSSPVTPLLELGSHPVSHHYVKNRDDSEYKHPVNIHFCESCGLIQLVDGVPEEKLYTNYVTLSSWKSHPHIPQLLELLKKLTGLKKETKIVEVGSNDGSFLEVLRENGFTNSVGIEPALDCQAAAKTRGVETFCDYLTPETADTFLKRYGSADLVISRHVVEHITELQPFSDAFRKLCKPGTFVLIEVPYFDFCLDALDYSAIWEQHSNYFTKATLKYVLERTGIELLHHQSFVFSGKAQVAIGRFTGKTTPTVLSPEVRANIKERALYYKDSFPRFKAGLHAFLKEWRSTKGKIASYGAGSRTCSFTNFLDIGQYLEFIADDQPEKQKFFMPGSKLPIVPGAELDSSDVTLCLLGVNAEMEEKVISKHQEFLRRGGQFRSTHPPSTRLLDIWADILGSRISAATK